MISASLADTSCSVILPVFNRAHCIAEPLESVLNQTVAPGEVIVVDDGSTDDLKAALAPYWDKIVYVSQSNAGVAAARNFAAKHAKHPWLAFQDSDDLWEPDHLEIVKRDLAQANETVVAHIGDVNYVGDGYSESLFGIKGVTFPNNKAECIENALQLVLSGMTLQAAAVRREVFTAMGGFDESMRMLSDTEFFCRLSQQGAFMVTQDCVASIQRLEGDSDSITSLHRKNAIYAREMHARCFINIPLDKLDQQQRSLLAGAKSGAIFRLAEVTRLQSRWRAAKLLGKSIALHPNKAKATVKALVAFVLGQRGYALVLRGTKTLDRS